MHLIRQSDHKQLLLLVIVSFDWLFTAIEHCYCKVHCMFVPAWSVKDISMVQFNYSESRFSQLNLKLDWN